MNRKKGIIFSYLLMVVEMLSSLLFTPYLIRCLGKSEYGVFSLVASISTYILLLDGGVGNALIKYITKYRVTNDIKKQNEFIGITIIFYFIISIIAIIISFVFGESIMSLFAKGLSGNELNLASTLLKITSLDISFKLITMPFSKILIAYEYFSLSKTLDIFKIIFRISLSALLLFLGFGSIAVTLINMSMTMFFGFITVAIVKQRFNIKPVFKNFDLSFILEIIQYSFYVFIMMLATQLNLMVDQILIGATVVNSAVILGVYAAGSQINVYLQNIANSINGVLMPGVMRFIELKKKKIEIENEMIRIGRLVFALLSMIWITFLINGKEFIVLWAGKEFEKSYYVALIIMLPSVFVHTLNTGSSVLYALNKHKVQAILKCIIAVSNILLTYILIKVEPLIGASTGTAISLLFGDIIVMEIVFCKFIGINIKRFNKSLFFNFFIPVTTTIIFGFLLKSFIINFGLIKSFVSGVMLIIIIYFILLWVFTFNKTEKKYIQNFFRRKKI